MIKVHVTKTSYYPVSSVKIRKEIQKFLKKNKVTSDTEMSVALIGKKRMMDLAKKHLDETNSVHNVLSFTTNEITEDFVFPPGSAIQLGEVVVCYPKAVEEAKKENKLIDDKVLELIKHGTMHLMGVHHD